VPRQRLKTKPKVKQAPARQRPIVVVGVGNMGGAFARGLIAAGLGPRLVLIDPMIKPAAAKAFRAAGAIVAPDARAIAEENPEAVILAVKPQMMAEVAPTYAEAARKALVISIAAGTSIESLSLWLENPRALVRAMPNLPASIGRGISAAFATPTTTASQRKLAATLFGAVGDLVWLEGEELLNAVTAVSGSGPAYVFLLAEALAAAAERQGLAADIAKRLARKTVEGAAALLAAAPTDPGELRRSVTSPGGTTEAALKVLMADARFEALLVDAVAAATARGFELAKTR
jgi:pyrroline-5-carboxylate reductase